MGQKVQAGPGLLLISGLEFAGLKWVVLVY